MAPSATFCNVALSTAVDSSSATSRVSLDWILSAGISAPGSVASGILTLPCGDTVCSMHTKLSVTSTLPYDVVLGRDWLFFCRETLPHTSFDLSSGSTQTQVLWMSMLNPVRVRPRKHRHVLVYAMNLWFAAAHLRLVHNCPLH
ncbi:hypothetical protein K438DRAFT_1985325 [Mycena galopus ATCC 62051]|nr:hypothetical protein K438DRAFT_1985325 [Mycena galopus ATCC 62051]